VLGVVAASEFRFAAIRRANESVRMKLSAFTGQEAPALAVR